MSADIIVLALGASINPTLLVIVLFMLAQSRPRQLLVAYLLGGFAISVGIGVALSAGLAHTSVAASHEGRPAAILSLVVGVLLLVVAALVSSDRVQERRRQHRERKTEKRSEKGYGESKKHKHSLKDHLKPALPSAFLLGIATSMPGGCYLIAMRDVAASGWSPGGQLLLVVGFNIVMFAWAEIPLLYYAHDPDGTVVKLRRAQDWLLGHMHKVIIFGALLAGAYLIISGLAHLL